MSELRTTTIDLSEYDVLKERANSSEREVGYLNREIEALKEKIKEINEKSPLIKITHFREEYDDYDDRYTKEDKIEFINLSEVTEMADKRAKYFNEKKIKELEEKVKKDEVNIENLQEAMSNAQRRCIRLENKKRSELEELREDHKKELLTLKKSYDSDVDNYEDKIKELNNTIEEIKNNRDYEELEKNRKKEISELKGRITDLEGIISNIEKMKFVDRIFKFKFPSKDELKKIKERDDRRNSDQDFWNNTYSAIIFGNKLTKNRKTNLFQHTWNKIFGLKRVGW